MMRYGKQTKAAGAGFALLVLAIAPACLDADASREEALLAGAPGAGGESWMEAWDETAGPQLPTLAELVTALGLSDEQAAVFGPALETLSTRMEALRPRGPRGPGEGGRRGGHGLPGGFGDFERPMHTFLESVVPVLEPAQVEVLADFFQERRDAHREDRQENGGRGRHGGPMLGMILRHLGDELGLEADQREAIVELMDGKRDEFRALREGFAEGTLTAEQLRDESKAFREEIETALAQILSAEQLARLEELLAEKRAEMAERRLTRLGEGIDERATFLANVLELDEGTAAAVRAVLESSTAERRAVLEELRDGTIEIEDALYRGYVIAQEMKTEIAGLLDADQARVFEALHRLLPGGGRHGR